MFKSTIIYFSSVQKNCRGNFCVKIFLDDFRDDCSIRVIRSSVKNFRVKNFCISFAYENYFTTKKANYKIEKHYLDINFSCA